MPQVDRGTISRCGRCKQHVGAMREVAVVSERVEQPMVRGRQEPAPTSGPLNREQGNGGPALAPRNVPDSGLWGGWSSGRILRWGLVLLGLVLVPVWLCRYFPSHNGPPLLSITHLAKHLHDPQLGYERFYENRFYPVPYLAQHSLQWVLLDLVEDRHVPRLVTLLAVLLRFWAVWYWLGGVAPGETGRRWLCWLVLPAALEFVLLRGYVNFHLGSSLVLVIYGWYLRYRDRWSPWSLVVWNLLTLATYFCHVIPVALAGLLIAVDETVRTGRPLRVIRLALLGFTPVLILLAGFMLHSRANTGWGANELIWASPGEKLRSLVTRWGTPLSTLVRWGGLALLGWPLLLRLSEWRAPETPVAPAAASRAERWAVPAAWFTMVLVYLACPKSLFGWHKADLHLLPLVPLLWLGATPIPRSGWRVAAVPLVAALLGLAGIVPISRALIQGSAEVEEYLAGLEAVPPRQALLSLVVEGDQSGDHQVFSPTQWADSYYLIRRGGGLGRSLVMYNTIYPVWFHDFREGGQRQFPPVDAENPTAGQLERAAQVYGAAMLWNVSDDVAERLEQAGFEPRFQQGRLRVLVNPAVAEPAAASE